MKGFPPLTVLMTIEKQIGLAKDSNITDGLTSISNSSLSLERERERLCVYIAILNRVSSFC